ncbi:mitochondrial processing peptidase alpha subunit [Pseudovirgaria hyperparasitica]|uniref:Mitochondrial-processing peptidase subunit alpha n=1 Tax=Pseudovirgaria hyperparasitica TaxID=470096 RepID=A0A6A6WKC0_9PEZI|nr:mitochondrial processing peptidase alpha subunit [Pseudovirgaria hyperparasitica]KAF2762621.1 mitochondrial processing peptidase alpha subunit [Pseudovirgaria hyperparasitica]
MSSSRALRALPRRLQGLPKAHPSQQTASTRSLATICVEEKDPAELDQVTTLPNGLRVATEALPGHFAGVGVYIDAGSRYENESLRGASHIVDRLALKSTKARTSDQMLESIESLGGNIQCASSRESLMYQSATFNSAVPTTLALLAETIRQPLVTDEELESQLATAEYEIGEIWSKPELILPELVHMAAYNGNTLGNPLLCPKDRLDKINRSTIETYLKTLYKPERMVVAFAGVDHSDAIRLVEDYFGDMKNGEGPSLPSPSELQAHLASLQGQPSDHAQNPASTNTAKTSTGLPVQEPSRLLSKIPFLKNLSTSATVKASVNPLFDISTPTPDQLAAPSHYTGGFLALPTIPPPMNPNLPRLSHINLAFEALSIESPDIYALAILQILLGGGGSFSAGGPGKGMYSRLYTNVLNQNIWVENCVAFNNSYTDSGVFGISASCMPGQIREMLEVMCRELDALSHEHGYKALKAQEVQRAKNQLRSSLLMNLESRMVGLEDLGRQVQVHGRKVGVKEMCRKIEEVSIQDLRRVAREVFSGQVYNKGQGTGAPTVVIQEGDMEGLKRKDFGWQEIQERIARHKLGRR